MPIGIVQRLNFRVGIKDWKLPFELQTSTHTRRFQQANPTSLSEMFSPENHWLQSEKKNSPGSHSDRPKGFQSLKFKRFLLISYAIIFLGNFPVCRKILAHRPSRFGQPGNRKAAWSIGSGTPCNL